MSTSNSSEPMQEDLLQEDSFSSHIPLPSLQQLASVQVVLPMLVEHYSQKEDIFFHRYDTFSCDLRLRMGVESLKTPRTIEKILTKAAGKIAKALDIWMKHFRSHDFLSVNLDCHICINPNWCVWLPSGEIDYKQTADEMLSSCELDETQKFAIMCAYCLEDEIKAFDSSSLPEYSMKKMNLKRDFLIAYWIFSLKNKLHHLFDGISGSIDAAMAKQCDGERAFKYFWNRLGNEDRISVAQHRISRFGTHGHMYFCQDQLFSMMTSAEQLHLLSTLPDEIIINFWLLVRSPSLVCWASKYSKNAMTAKRFARVVEKIFQARIGSDKDMQMLIDVWDMAPIQFKTYAAKRLVNVIFSPSQFGKLMSIVKYSYFEEDGLPWNESASKYAKKEYALKFLYKFLSQVNADTRRQLMLKHAIAFGVKIYDPRLMTDVICLCLPSSEDQLLYKKKIMDSHTMSEHWAKDLHCGNGIEHFKSQLEVYSTDVKATQEVTKRVLQSKSLQRSYFFNASKWSKMSKFIDETFHDDPTSASNLKKQLLSSLFTSTEQHNDWNQEDEKIDAMMKIAEQVFTPEELAVEKRRFAQARKSRLQNREFCWQWFEINYFSKLMTWCLGDGEALLKFKKSFSIDKIFLYVMDEVNLFYCNDSHFQDNLLHRLDDFLNWIFPSAEETTKYKLNRLETVNLNEFAMFSHLVDYDEYEYLPELLGWFHNVNPVPSEVIDEFKARVKESC
ncbi:uncharacterized protein Mettl4 isoform X1 [Planococcus citri]|uniref:uncharacterized protein Mettl4 isoform X1 n=1 Tax=Planococcus citri TaxID=170843 RepID=UPI0031F7EEA4